MPASLYGHSRCAEGLWPRRLPTRSRGTSALASPRRSCPRTTTPPRRTTSTPWSTRPRAAELEVFHWGLVPVWAKDIKIGQKMINARAETLATERVQARVQAQALHHPGRRLLRVAGPAPGEQAPSSRTSSTASTVSRSPSPACGRRGATRPPGRTRRGCTRARSSPRRPTTTMAADPRPHAGDPAAAAWDDWLDPANQDLVELQRPPGAGARRPADDAPGVDRREQRPQQGRAPDRPDRASTDSVCRRSSRRE